MARAASNRTIPMNWGENMKPEEAPICNERYSASFGPSDNNEMGTAFFGGYAASVPSVLRPKFDKFITEINAYVKDHPITEYCSMSDSMYNMQVGPAVKAQQLMVDIFGAILPGVSGEDLAGTVLLLYVPY